MEPYFENLPLLASSPPDLAEPQDPTDSLVDSPHTPRDLPPPNFVRHASLHANELLAWSFVLGRKLAAPPLLATLAGGTLLYIGYSRGPAKTGITPGIPDAATTISQPSAAAVASIPEPQYALTVMPTEDTIMPTEDTIKPQPAKPSAARLLKRDTPASKTIRHQKHSPIESPPDNAPQRSILHADVEEADTPQPNESTDVVAKTKRDVGYTLTHAPARSGPPSPRVVNVSSGVMAANLVSASPPSYPKLAGLTHMQGEVVMQAIISKDGTVENLHVIQGHRLLRGAAKNSARTWRYRPYLVNGKPVEVATIVSVDFTLPH
jgi:outer membrane biosynthesis protein TonB